MSLNVHQSISIGTLHINTIGGASIVQVGASGSIEACSQTKNQTLVAPKGMTVPTANTVEISGGGRKIPAIQSFAFTPPASLEPFDQTD